MPKMSVRPTDSRNSSTPYERPFSAWASRSERSTRRRRRGRARGPDPGGDLLRGQGAAGAGIRDVRDPVDGDVVESAGDLFHLAHVDERLDDVVRLRIEPEAAARAVELHLGDGRHELILVLRVAVHRLQRAHDDLGRVVALAREAV